MADSSEETMCEAADEALRRVKGKSIDLGCGNNEDFSEDGERNAEIAALNNERDGNVSGEEVITGDMLPQRLFATHRYPAGGRINSYSRAELLQKLAEVIHGSPEFEWIQKSCFGKLFELPVRMSPVSGKLVHQILCRSLVTAKKHEMWFVFGGHPIRFSLRDFAIITGLNCQPLPPEPETEPTTDHWKRILGPNSSYSMAKILHMLKLDKRLPEGDKDKMDWERRLRLALIVIVDGVLVCESSVVRATKKVVEMVNDLQEFVKYPWGRLSFSKTLEMVKVGNKVENLAALTDKLGQSHTAMHGFTLALQLLILNAIPSLQNHLPDVYGKETFGDPSVAGLTQLKTFHNANILQTEMDPQLVVESILKSDDPAGSQDYTWADEDEDAAVDVLLSKVNEGYIFNKDIWQGGLSEHQSITSCLSAHKKPKKPAPVIASKGSKAPKAPKVRESKRSKEKQASISKGKQEADEGAPSDFAAHAMDAEIKELVKAQVKELVQQQHDEQLGKIRSMMDVERACMRDEIVDDVIKALKELGVLKTADGEEVWEDATRDYLKKSSSYNTQGVFNEEMSFEENNQEFGGPGIAEILTSINAQCKDPKVGEDVNAEQGREGNRGADFTEGNTEKEYSIPDEATGPNTTEDIFADVVMETTAEYEENLVEPKDRKDDGVADDVDEYLVDGSDGVEGSAGVQEIPGVQDRGDGPVCGDGQVCGGKGTDGGGGEKTNDGKEGGGGGGGQEGDGPVCGDGQVCGGKGTDGGGGEETNDGKEGGGGGGGQEGEQAESSVKECFIAVAGKKRKDPVAGQELEPLPPKRANRYANTYVHNKKKAKAGGGDAKKKATGVLFEAAEKKGAVDGDAAAPDKAPADGGDEQKQDEVVGDAYGHVYMPFGIVQPTIKEKFMDQLKSYSGDAYTIEGHAVGRDFFEQLYTPTKWVGSIHIEAMLNTMWRTLGDKFVQSRIAVLDTGFIQCLGQEFKFYEKTADNLKEKYGWDSMFKKYVRGKMFNRPASLGWFTDVDTVYAPMHCGKGHWVSVVIKLREGKILILDPLIGNHDDRQLSQVMKPLVTMVPIFCRIYPKPKPVDCPIPESFTLERVRDVYQTERSGDCGLLAVKFIELHAQGIELDTLTESLVDEMRLKFAVNIYEDYVQSLRD